MEPNGLNADLANMKVECQHQSSTESVNTLSSVLLLSFFLINVLISVITKSVNYLWEIYFVFKSSWLWRPAPAESKQCKFQAKFLQLGKGRVGNVDCQRTHCNEENKIHMSWDL